MLNTLTAQLATRLSAAGLKTIELGTFDVKRARVPPGSGIGWLPSVRYPCLVPDKKGLEHFRVRSHYTAFFRKNQVIDDPGPNTNDPLFDEIAICAAATDASSQATAGCTVAESLARLEPVAGSARGSGLRVRGYVGAAVVCPRSGRVDGQKVKDVARALLDMGCSQVTLCDTLGAGTPGDVRTILEAVMSGPSAPAPAQLAGHFYDTYGMGLANIFAALALGVRTFNASIAGLGAHPLATGAPRPNVSTEDLVYALRGSGYTTDVDALVQVGYWFTDMLGRQYRSAVGEVLLMERWQREAALAKKRREEEEAEEERRQVERLEKERKEEKKVAERWRQARATYALLYGSKLK